MNTQIWQQLTCILRLICSGTLSRPVFWRQMWISGTYRRCSGTVPLILLKYIPMLLFQNNGTFLPQNTLEKTLASSEYIRHSRHWNKVHRVLVKIILLYSRHKISCLFIYLFTILLLPSLPHYSLCKIQKKYKLISMKK